MAFPSTRLTSTRTLHCPLAPASGERVRERGLLARLALTGLLGIGYEVLVVRVLCQVTEDTVYTFAMLLAVYLVGSAAGAAGYRRWLVARRDRDALLDTLLGALAAAGLKLSTRVCWPASLSTFNVSSPSQLTRKRVGIRMSPAAPYASQAPSFAGSHVSATRRPSAFSATLA